MEEKFVHEDGSIDTPKEEIIALDALLQDLEAKLGKFTLSIGDHVYAFLKWLIMLGVHGGSGLLKDTARS